MTPPSDASWAAPTPPTDASWAVPAQPAAQQPWEQPTAPPWGGQPLPTPSGRPPIAVIALLGVAVIGAVIAGVLLFHHGKKAGSDALTPANGLNLGVDIRQVLTSEQTYYLGHGTFTQSLSDLVGQGFTEVAGTDATLVVGAEHENGFCVVGNIGSSAPFALFDSEGGGLSDTQFTSQAAAEANCTQVTHITSFSSLDGAPTSAAVAPPATQTFSPGVPLDTEGVSGLQAQQQEAVKSNLRNLATAEESYLTDSVIYTTSSAGLDRDGYQPIPATVHVVAGVNGSQDYCLAGSYDGKAPWTVYDSRAGGIQTETYRTAAAAEKSCADQAIKHFKTIT
jgi:hypothetical protein